ncbi:conserved hypothetical protein [Borreliella spielmanii A14S]|uniref:NADH dehydrogenase subunit 4L n=2 Tax=Borreliella spielmanii TaxID=88916 RepID=B9X8N3_9SPIR|nr:conserved hypothetical protein [Borreliella spielmanii A14S]
MSINLFLMFLVFFLEFLLVVKFSIIVKPYLQFILIFMMIVFAVLVGYFVSIFIVRSLFIKLFKLDQ